MVNKKNKTQYDIISIDNKDKGHEAQPKVENLSQIAVEYSWSREGSTTPRILKLIWQAESGETDKQITPPLTIV